MTDLSKLVRELEHPTVLELKLAEENAHLRAEAERLTKELEKWRSLAHQQHEALCSLANACDTHDRNSDGTQRGVRNPEKEYVEAARVALAAYERLEEESERG